MLLLESMMRKKTLTTALVLLGFSVSVFAQQAARLDNRLSDSLVRMQSQDLRTREIAFQDLISNLRQVQGEQANNRPSEVVPRFLKNAGPNGERVKTGLIGLLNTENNTFQGRNVRPQTYSEVDMEHYAGVIEAVASLDDERAIPVLVGAMTTGGMASERLLAYGDKALQPVLAQLDNPDIMMRTTAVELSTMMLQRKGDPASNTRAKNILRAALTDRSSTVRSAAISQIKCLVGREEFLPALEQIAKSDPTKLSGKALDGGDGDEFYPVRYDARRAIRAIQSREICRP
jgi:hypothetical protein